MNPVLDEKCACGVNWTYLVMIQAMHCLIWALRVRVKLVISLAANRRRMFEPRAVEAEQTGQVNTGIQFLNVKHKLRLRNIFLLEIATPCGSEGRLGRTTMAQYIQCWLKRDGFEYNYTRIKRLALKKAFFMAVLDSFIHLHSSATKTPPGETNIAIFSRISVNRFQWGAF